MNYISLVFFIFLLLFFIIYHCIPPKKRYIVLFIGSYIFYGYANPKMLLALILITSISYVGGLAINKWHNRLSYSIPFILEILVLFIFKYINFTINSINWLMNNLSLHAHLNINWNLALPIGLSFIIFQSCTYLSDVYRKNFKIEKNIIKYAAFVAFFPTILSGPIQKARNLLPQINNPKKFELEDGKQGTMLFIWGLFEKIMIANNLSALSNSILNNYINHSSFEVLIGAIAFSLYIYADFSSYSDMARGISRLLGIDVGKNFNNPYLSKSISEFWNRWHISLNEWFIENIYIPLGGNRKGKLRKYINILIVFLISGLWHGAYWHFVVWGLLNGVFSIIGQIIKPLKSKIYNRIKIDEEVESIVFIKRAIVFYLITLTWVFFNKDISVALEICKKIVLFDYLSLFDPNILSIFINNVNTFILILMITLFCIIQIKRQNEEKVYEKYSRQPFIFQCLVLAIIICVCIFGSFSTTNNVDNSFLYFNF